MLKKIVVFVGVVVVVSVGAILMSGESSYSDCILENMPKAQTKAAAMLMKRACREKYPEKLDFSGVVNPPMGEKKVQSSLPELPPGFVLDGEVKLKEIDCDPFKESLSKTVAAGKGVAGKLPPCSGDG